KDFFSNKHSSSSNPISDDEESPAVTAEFCRLCIRRIRIFRRRKPSSIRCSYGNEDAAPSPSVVMDSDFDAKTFRKNLTRSITTIAKGLVTKRRLSSSRSGDASDGEEGEGIGSAK
ncbi:unnamed protein product, partial [Brassica oleracea]